MNYIMNILTYRISKEIELDKQINLKKNKDKDKDKDKDISKIYNKNDSQKKVVKDISDDNFIKFQWAWIL